LDFAFFDSIISIITVVVFVGKAYHDHIIIGEVKNENASLQTSFALIEKENLKIAEALNRTFVSKEYLFKYFYTQITINEKLKHIEKIISLEEKRNTNR